MKDNSQIYEVPPKLLPGSANSVSLVFDYSGQEFESEEALKDQMMQDNVLAMFGTNFKLADQSIMEIQVYGTKDGKTLFHSRAHQMKLQMECDYGIYKRTAIKKRFFCMMTAISVHVSLSDMNLTQTGLIKGRRRTWKQFY